MKKVLSLVLALALLVILTASVVYAEEAPYGGIDLSRAAGSLHVLYWQ